MAYLGRPGLPPAVALLVATGRLRPRHRVLDVGCGTGTDALLLGAWGFRHVVGVDPDARAIAAAKARARRRGLDGTVRFERAAAEDLVERFGPRRFDAVLHTLVANNLREGIDRHFAAVAAVLKPRGLLVLHERLAAADENAPPGQVAPLEELTRWFRLTPGVTTQLAERRVAGAAPHARVALWLGRPKPRRASGGGRREPSPPRRGQPF